MIVAHTYDVDLAAAIAAAGDTTGIVVVVSSDPIIYPVHDSLLYYYPANTEEEPWEYEEFLPEMVEDLEERITANGKVGNIIAGLDFPLDPG